MKETDVDNEPQEKVHSPLPDRWRGINGGGPEKESGPNMMGNSWNPSTLINMWNERTSTGAEDLVPELDEALDKLDEVMAAAAVFGIPVPERPVLTSNLVSDNIEVVKALSTTLGRQVAAAKARNTTAKKKEKQELKDRALERARILGNVEDGTRWFFVTGVDPNWLPKMEQLAKKAQALEGKAATKATKALAKLTDEEKQGRKLTAKEKMGRNLRRYAPGLILLPGGYAYLQLKVREAEKHELPTGKDSYGRPYIVHPDLVELMGNTVGRFDPARTVSKVEVMKAAGSGDRIRWAKALGMWDV